MEQSEKIARLNDALRKTFIGGRTVLTHGVASLEDAVRASILAAVQRFDDFNEGDDPYGEHDFGAVTVDQQRCFWKIDYYENDLKYTSEDAAEPTKTTRVLTIMLASEY